LSESGIRTANFVDDGTDASGGFHVTETSTGTFDRTTTGDSNSGATQIDETSSTDYTVTEIISGTSAFTMIETGTDAPTTTETDDTVTGDYSIIGSGTDLYTLGESGTLGGVFSDLVTGTDVYASTETGNHTEQTYDRTTTGGGDWVRTASGGTLASGSGTNGYTLTESGDQAAGHFSQSEMGRDRYGLVQSFDDVSNANGGATPGNVTFHSHGLAFRDPDDDECDGACDCQPQPTANPPQLIDSFSKYKAPDKIGEYTRPEFEKLINNGKPIIDPSELDKKIQLQQFIDNTRLNTGCIGVTHMAIKNSADFSQYLNQQLGAKKFRDFLDDPKENVIIDKMKNAVYPQAYTNVKGPWRDFEDAKNLRGEAPLGPNDKYVIFAFISDWNNKKNEEPMLDKNGKYDVQDLVFKKDGDIAMWDYAVYQPSTKLWVNANHAIDPKGKYPQKFYVKNNVEPFEDPGGNKHKAIVYYAYIVRGK
jgi:hypothetical protein